MSTQHILVVGGTGMLGEPVARRLQAEGHTVRILTRSPERARATFGPDFEVRGGTLDDAAALDAALADCTGVHLNLPGTNPTQERAGALTVTAAAVRAGLTRITYLSGASVCEENCWYEGTKAKFDAETAIKQSGIPYTIFAATWFMESLPKLVRGKRALVMGRQPHPAHWVAADDYARMVAAAYVTPGAENKRLLIYGPQAYTIPQALAIYTGIVRPEARITPLPLWLVGVIARLGRRAELRAALPFFAYHQQAHEIGDPAEANALLGAPQTTLERWSHTHPAIY